VPIDLFSGVVNNLTTERLSLEGKNGAIEIKTDNYRATIQGAPPEEFPIIPQIKSQESINLSGELFGGGLNQVVFAAQPSDLRPELGSVLFEYSTDEIKLVATDSVRLAEKTIFKNQYKSNINEAFRALIPLKTAQELQRALKDGDELEIFKDQHQILFKTQRFSLISRLIDGTFPDYGAIIPKKFDTEIIINKNELLSALKLASVFSSKVNEVHIRALTDQKNIEVFSLDQSLGDNDCTLPAQIKGTNKETGFNWRYLSDGLRATEGESVLLGINEENKPAQIKSQTDNSYFYILMPNLKA